MNAAVRASAIWMRILSAFWCKWGWDIQQIDPNQATSAALSVIDHQSHEFILLPS